MSLSHEVPILRSANYGTQAQPGRNHPMRMIEASVRTTKTARRKHRKSIRNPRPSQRANLSGPFASSNWKLKSLRRRSSTRTEYHSRILTPVKDPPEASTTIDQKALTATLKKCYSPISLAIATFVTAGIYFVLQYELSVEANHLALRESCRSHPNDTYLQNLATCQEARLTGDVDLHRRSLVASTGAVASRHGITFSQFLIDMAEWVLRALMSIKGPIIQLYELIQNCMFYWVVITVIWKSTAAIWSCVLKRRLLELATLFFEIEIVHSQRGLHVWVRRRRLSWVLPFLKSLGRLFSDYCTILVVRLSTILVVHGVDFCISIVGTLSAILVAYCARFREREMR